MPSVVYFVQSSKGVKIGYSGQVQTRITALRCQHKDLKVLGYISGSYSTEVRVQQLFWQHRIAGDWFRPHDDLLKWISRYTVPTRKLLPYKVAVELPTLPPKGKKVVFTVTDDMEEALNEEARRRGAPVASVVREVLKEFFAKQGKKVDSEVTWGGNRRADKKE